MCSGHRNHSYLFSDEPELEYSKCSLAARRRQYSQIFTPFAVADFMVSWILRNDYAPKTVLDPAFGMGVFSRALAHRSMQPLTITGYEMDSDILAHAQPLMRRLNSSFHFRYFCTDFLLGGWEDTYDAVIANPPYRNFRELPQREQWIAEFAQNMGVSPTSATNLYGFFLLKALAHLRPGGRCAFLIPSEFLQADYGLILKRYLLEQGLQSIVFFGVDKSLFPAVLTTSCLILLERNTVHTEVELYTVHDVEALQELTEQWSNRTDSWVGSEELAVRVQRSAMDPGRKWSEYLSSYKNLEIRNHSSLTAWMRISRGIATGANDFFLLNQSKVQNFGLGEMHLEPIITKARHVATDCFRIADWEANKVMDREVYLLRVQEAYTPAITQYIQLGLDQGINTRYLPKRRNPWYSSEAVQPAPIWVGVFNRGALRFIRNESGLRHLTAFHGVYPHNGHSDFLDLLMAYLLTPWARQLMYSQRREYGGGLVKFEPGDFSQASVVNFAALNTDQVRTILVHYRHGLRSALMVEPGTCWLSELDYFFRAWMS